VFLKLDEKRGVGGIEVDEITTKLTFLLYWKLNSSPSGSRATFLPFDRCLEYQDLLIVFISIS
jgi:hypothetical protein